MGFLNFFKMSGPSEKKVPVEQQDKVYKSLRFQTFVAGTIGYSLYYVCRTGLNVVKGPIIQDGFLTATQLGAISSCLLYAYAAGKFVNGVLADRSNIKRFMAAGLSVSAFTNLVFGLTGLWSTGVGTASSLLVLLLCGLWTLNGWAQSMGTAPAVIGLSRWYPLSIRGTYYGFFSSSHNIGEGLSFVFCGALVGLMGWQWGFMGSALAGLLGVIIIMLFMHDNPESKGLKQVELLTGEKTQEEIDAEAAAKAAAKASADAEAKEIQKSVFKNPGVWFLALASGFMYVARYAVNGWGTLVLEGKGFSTTEATSIISINAWCGIFGTVLSGFLSDKLFKGDRQLPALVAGILHVISLIIFLYGGDSVAINVLAMILRGLAIGVLICFLGGLMAVDIVPRKASGSALGIVGLVSYIFASTQDIVSGILIDKGTTVVDGVKHIDFTQVGYLWIGAAIISFILPLFNWKKRQTAN
ncbi:MAG: MFS transporter [Bacteroidales bacterium]|nr:MFS transporter [Bacteroidales bacterium]